jgi:hypothetical protein
MPKLNTVSLAPKLLERGFWLYVWKIALPSGSFVHYVGMTGDTVPKNGAQSAFKRITDHLGINKNSNQLRKWLLKRNARPEACRSLDFFAYGPIGKVPTDPKLYAQARGKIAALERSLCMWLRDAGYVVLHDDPRCSFSHSEEDWKPVREAFSKHFPEAGSV